MISVEEDSQSVVSLPERYITKAQFFETSEVMVWSFVVPLRTSGVPGSPVSVVMTPSFLSTYWVSFFTLGAIDGTT